MIKYLIALLLFSSTCIAGMGIGEFPYPGPGTLNNTTTGCNTTHSYSQENYSTSVAWLGSGYKTGGHYAYSAGYSICSLDFYVGSVVGNISSKTFTVSVYSVSGYDLNAELASTTISGSVIGVGWNNVQFTVPVSTGSSGFAIVIIPPTTDGSNYFTLSSSGSSLDANATTRRWSGLTSNSSNSYDISLRIYE